MSSTMRFVTDLSKGILGSADSTELWNEIISHIPDEVLLKPDVKILNVAFGYGTEADIIVKRMLGLGRTLEDVKNAITLVDKYHVFTNRAIRKGYVKVETADFLEWKTNMKFDVVVGNPPYKGDVRCRPLWMKFLEKSINLCETNGFIALITPASWLAPGDSYELITSRALQYVSLDIQKYFDVSSTFSYYIIRNCIPIGVTSVWNGQDEIDIDFSKIQYLPLSITPLTVSINNKTVNDNSQPKINFIRTSEYHTSNKDKFTKTGCVTVLHTNAQTLFSNINHPNNSLHRVTITLSGYPTPTYIHNKAATQAMAWASTPTKHEGKQLEKILRMKLYQFLIQQNKWSGWNSLSVLKTLPLVDLTKPWTDAELYAHFNLTPEEINLIESTVK